MEKRRKRRARKRQEEAWAENPVRERTRASRVLSVTGTGMIVVVIILCSLLVLPGIFGFHMYHVLSGSMEPAVRVGSLIYVYEGQPEDIVEKDIIAFYSSLEDGGIITHRVLMKDRKSVV